MSLVPKRRWLRFSIRALLILIAACCCLALWIGSQCQIVNERARMRRMVLDAGGRVSTIANPFAIPGKLGLLRRWLGESEVGYFFDLDKLPAQDQEHLKRVFPEAETDMSGPWRIGTITIVSTSGGAE